MAVDRIEEDVVAAFIYTLTVDGEEVEDLKEEDAIECLHGAGIRTLYSASHPFSVKDIPVELRTKRPVAVAAVKKITCCFKPHAAEQGKRRVDVGGGNPDTGCL